MSVRERGGKAEKDVSGEEGRRKRKPAHLLLRGVGIVESNQKPSLVHPGKVLVQNSGLGVSNVEVTRGLRRKTGNDVTLDSVGKSELEGRVGRGSFSRGDLGRGGLLGSLDLALHAHGLDGLAALGTSRHVREPPSRVRQLGELSLGYGVGLEPAPGGVIGDRGGGGGREKVGAEGEALLEGREEGEGGGEGRRVRGELEEGGGDLY